MIAQHRVHAGWPWLTAVAAALAAGLWLALGPLPASLVFDRAAVAGGELWRLVTAHLVHGDGRHAFWDIAALVLLGVLMEPQGSGRMAQAAGAGVLAVDTGLWWGMPALEGYCGLSGVLNALFVVALADLWRRFRHPLFPLAGLGLALKLAFEMAAGHTVLADTLWPGLPSAHLAGCLGGLLCVLLARPADSDHPDSGEKR